jgi:hypothetical protein
VIYKYNKGLYKVCLGSLARLAQPPLLSVSAGLFTAVVPDVWCRPTSPLSRFPRDRDLHFLPHRFLFDTRRLGVVLGHAVDVAPELGVARLQARAVQAVTLLYRGLDFLVVAETFVPAACVRKEEKTRSAATSSHKSISSANQIRRCWEIKGRVPCPPLTSRGELLLEFGVDVAACFLAARDDDGPRRGLGDLREALGAAGFGVVEPGRHWPDRERRDGERRHLFGEMREVRVKRCERARSGDDERFGKLSVRDGREGHECSVRVVKTRAEEWRGPRLGARKRDIFCKFRADSELANRAHFTRRATQGFAFAKKEINFPRSDGPSRSVDPISLLLTFVTS